MAIERVAIVTGASRGIGAAVARRLARDGLAIVVNYARSDDKAQAVVDAIERAGGTAFPCEADVSDPAAMRKMFDAAIERFGGVDVLINNAGILQLATLDKATDEMFDELVAVNLKGVFNGLREASRRLRDGGRIVSFSTSVVGLYMPTYGLYVATKAAVEAMTRVLAKELGDRCITVNAIAPGPTATDLFLEDKPDEVVERIVERTPLDRLGEPVDIARAVSFLVGPDGGWVNGQVLRVNGGII